MKATKPGHVGAWFVLAALVTFLILAIAFMYVGWGPGEGDPGQQMSTAGYVAMALGIIVTLALGTGLMALVFYSNREGHDRQLCEIRRNFDRPGGLGCIELLLHGGDRHDALMRIFQMDTCLLRLHRTRLHQKDACDDLQAIGNPVLQLFEQHALSVVAILPFRAPGCAAR